MLHPVYVFIGGLVNSALNNPLLSLTLISAVLGSLSAVPFYLLARDLLGPRMALVGSILFLLNPLAWSFGESALYFVHATVTVSDVIGSVRRRKRRVRGAVVHRPREIACVVGNPTRLEGRRLDLPEGHADTRSPQNAGNHPPNDPRVTV